MSDTERKIVRRTIKALLAAGYNLSVYDGEETTVHASTDPKQIIDAMFTTDSDVLRVYKGGLRAGWVQFIYGNGIDVLSDHTTNLSDVLDPIIDYAGTLER